ncbi:MAG TPA: PH domain-containing protein [Syntrophomonas sp.]|nr:PH domain-containing protein [Syntrophomonas sp.]
MVFKTVKSWGALYGIIAGIIIFGFSIWGINYSLGADDTALKVLLYIPTYLFLVVYIYLVLGTVRLHYVVNDDNFVLVWGVAKKHIAWDEIDEIIQIEGKSNIFPFLSMTWPGYIVGLFQIKGVGPVRMYGTHAKDGFLYLKTQRGFLGLTPQDGTLAKIIAEKTGKEIQILDMNTVPVEVKGHDMHTDRFFMLYTRINNILLGVFCLYVAIFFPNSGADRLIILLVVLAIDLYLFNNANAKRLYQFSQQGGYFTLLIGMAVTGIFLILSIVQISFS